MHDTRTDLNRKSDNENKINELYKNLLNSDVKVHMLNVLNQSNGIVKTSLGSVPFGSVLSYQCAVVPPSYNVYYSLPAPLKNLDSVQYIEYPTFPFNETDDFITCYVEKIFCNKKINILENMKLVKEIVVQIEKETREQDGNSKWFDYRRNRFMASLCNKLENKSPKGLKSLAHKLVHGENKTKLNNIISYKLSYGKYYEPIALKYYENFMKSSGYKLDVEPCGLVLDEKNFVLGASPDRKVRCDNDCGIIEIKCSEEYSNLDPKDICFVAKNPSIIFDKSSNKILINKNHSYYDQIQMQLGLTTQTWCDFVFYTSKGLVIDCITYDKVYWGTLRKRVLNFYFNYMLDEIIEKINNNF